MADRNVRPPLFFLPFSLLIPNWRALARLPIREIRGQERELGREITIRIKIRKMGADFLTVGSYIRAHP